MSDFVDIIGSLTNFVQNERVAAHNEGVDEMLDAIRSWMIFEGIRMTSGEATPNESVPELLNEIKSHFHTPRESE